MSHAESPSTHERYGVVMVVQEWEISRSSYYAGRARDEKPQPAAGKRGPRTKLSDVELVERIRKVLSESDFVVKARILSDSEGDCRLLGVS
jgi:hypothetical protein